MNIRTVAVGLALIVQVSCSEEDFDINSFPDERSITTINGTWKVISFEDFHERHVELKTLENSWGTEITLTFDDTNDPHLFGGRVTTNGVSGEFSYVTTRKIKISNLLSTFINQPDWGNKFVDLILSGELDFMINKKRLRLFSNDRTNSVTLAAV